MIWNFRFDRYGKGFNYRLIQRPGPGLIVFFPSLAAQKRIDNISYNRLTWFDNVSCSCLYVADPGVTATIRGTWFQGRKEYYAIERVVSDIRTISDQFGYDALQTVLYGSSQGGFAALACGAFLSEAAILAECPQSDLRLFNQKGDTSAAAKAAYDVADFDTAPEEFRYRFNLTDLFRKRGYTPRASVIVKETDTHCLDLHVEPLLREGRDRIALEIIRGDEGAGGHTGLSKEVVLDALSRLRRH